ncbi:L,D-transpeptidase [Gaiella sp.]|uniref:L,D-transpeptidase n=1 Tax=Gaiella sp. TaxID=2663207 RepID=UPI003265E605
MKAFVLLAVLVGLIAVPAAGADATAPSKPSALAAVDVVGSGTIAWPSVAVRSQPSRKASVLKTMTQFRPDFRPRVVLALEQRTDAETGEPTWLRITIPGRPNGRSGWIPAASATLKPVDRWLVIYRGARKFEFYVNGKVVRSGRIAIGKKGTETPTGLFYVQAKFDPSWEVLGAYAFETSGYSKLSDWPGGGVVGVHGTNAPELIGQAVSHGCVRLLNKDIQYLRSVVPVGTPIKIVAA